MNSHPFFTIVMPTFNRADRIVKGIESVLSQTFEDFELVIVDDGSTDSTKQVVEGFKDPRIRYFFKENGERSLARNFGINNSNGKYINFLDSDDCQNPNHLQTAFRSLQEVSFPEALTTGFEIVREEDNSVILRIESFHNINAELINENGLTLNCIFVRKDVFSQDLMFIPNRKAVLSEDWCLLLRIAARFKIHSVNTVTCVAFEHESRSLNRLNSKTVESAIILVLENLEQDSIFMKYYSKSYNRFKSKQFCFIALHHVLEGNRSIAMRYGVNAYKAHPPILFSRNFLAVFKKILTPL